jgi:hypothetical protein
MKRWFSLAMSTKIRLFSVISVAKPKNFVVFASTYVSRSPELFYGDFFMKLYFVDSDEAMKR